MTATTTRPPGATVTPMRAEHAADVLDVYAAGIATGVATSQAQPPTWQEFDAGHLADHRYVALDGDASRCTPRRASGWSARASASDA